MLVNKINSNIIFKNNNNTKNNYRNTGSQNAILMLRDPQAAIKFQQNQEYIRKADSIDTNSFVALGYKLHRTFNMIKNCRTQNNSSSKLDEIA